MKRNNELYHWLKKGEAASDHKYIRRELKSYGWRYWYPEDLLSSLKSKRDRLISEGRRIIGIPTSKTSRTTIAKASAAVNQFSANTKNTIKKALAKVSNVKVSALKEPLGVKATKNSPAQLVALGKKAVDKLMGTRDKQLSPTEKADAKSIADSPKSWSELKKKTRWYSRDEDQAAVNPNYTSTEYKTTMQVEAFGTTFAIEVNPYEMNCQSCTLAYDARQRGYDVEAAPYYMEESFVPSIEGPDGINSWYKGVGDADWTTFTLPDDSSASSTEQSRKMYSDVEKLFNNMPNGSYGQFCVGWTFGSAHSVVWEKTNGTVTIRDCQSNKSFSFNQIMDEPNYSDCVGQVVILRTDDKELTDAALRRLRNP